MRVKVLIAEDEPDIIEMLQLLVEQELDSQVFIGQTGRAAIQILEENRDIALIISDVNMPNGNGFELREAALKIAPEAPFIFCTANDPAGVIKKLGPDAKNVTIINKPYFLDPIRALLKKLPEKVSKTTPESYCPVDVTVLRRLGLVPFKLYLKLAENKFVKISHSGEQFSGEDAEKYLKKNVYRLYLAREDASQLLEELHRTLVILGEKGESPESLNRAQAEALTMVRNFSETFGLSDSARDTVQSCVNCSMNFMLKHKQDFPSLSRYLDKTNDYFSTHSLLLCYFSAALARLMGWESQSVFLKLSYAALLHDVSLSAEEFDRIPELKAKTAAADASAAFDAQLGGMFDPEVKSFLQHPWKSARLLANFKDVPMETDLLILQHHEQPDGTGFPNRLSHSRIHQLSALLIYTEDLVDYVLMSREKKSSLSLMKEFCAVKADKYSEGIFRKIHEQLVLTVGAD